MTPPLVEEKVIVAVPVPVTVQETVFSLSHFGASMSVNGLSSGDSSSSPAKKPIVWVALWPEASFRSPITFRVAVPFLPILLNHACFRASGSLPTLAAVAVIVLVPSSLALMLISLKMSSGRAFASTLK